MNEQLLAEYKGKIDQLYKVHTIVLQTLWAMPESKLPQSRDNLCAIENENYATDCIALLAEFHAVLLCSQGTIN